MNNFNLHALIAQKCPFKPTPEQDDLLTQWESFLLGGHRTDVFLLGGFAGTGKTSMVSALVRTLMQLKQKVVLMAPTGRAAKVFADYADAPVRTIHKTIYRQKVVGVEDASFALANNLHHHTLFIVDEASMIAGAGAMGASAFGTGNLLDDLVHYVFSGEGCRLMLVGDPAQLPPVGEEDSPALNVACLEGYGLTVTSTTLRQVVRQNEGGVLFNATRLRECLENEEVYQRPVLSVKGWNDLTVVPGNELIEVMETAYHEVGVDDTIVVTRSNKRANIFNMGVRNQILGREEELSHGDRVMIVKNNYYWPELENQGKKDEAERCPMEFIANGEMAVVRRVRYERELYGFRFADVTLVFPDYNDYEMEVTALLDTLHSESPSLTREQQEMLFQRVMEDFADVPLKKNRILGIKQSPYYNALQLKYAYAVTCHKAQGGQWSRVFLDQGYVADDMVSVDYYRWLYTAFTRTTERLYLVNWPKEQCEDGEPSDA